MDNIRDIIDTIDLFESKQNTIEIVKLNHSESSFAPVMSTATVKYHYGTLAHGYADRYNKHEGDSTFNYAGAWLHNVFFTQFRTPRTNNQPNGPMGNLIISKFKSFENFKEQFKETALKLQGSGWIYLSRSGEIKTIHNHQVRNDILILVDMWEHAYNMDYGADKKRYLDNIWRIMDWNQLNTRWGAGYK
jgi:Fe-Mn family superoxide dismutase